jgi:hypothetical protein
METQGGSIREKKAECAQKIGLFHHGNLSEDDARATYLPRGRYKASGGQHSGFVGKEEIWSYKGTSKVTKQLINSTVFRKNADFKDHPGMDCLSQAKHQLAEIVWREGGIREK